MTSKPTLPASRSPLIQALDLVPIVWLALVAVAYGQVALNPATPESAKAPLFVLADRAALPVLSLLLFTAIIRYFCLRNGQPSSRRHATDEGQDTV